MRGTVRERRGAAVDKDCSREDSPESGRKGADSQGASAPEPGEWLALIALAPESFDEQAGLVTLRIGDRSVDAAIDAALHPSVVKTALARGERLIVQREGGSFVVLGALRTAPTPGVDPGEDYEIVAKRVAVRGAHELRLESGEATLVLRAYGMIETVAKDISARASRAHKLIGRLLQLN